mmetsp:Transcript_10693/g.32053  ORF Transcript_10693/g.32053 Transcript_10693/m.32053 type:complete len:201 (-) Transcript_10693:11-613(-)
MKCPCCSVTWPYHGSARHAGIGFEAQLCNDVDRLCGSNSHCSWAMRAHASGNGVPEQYSWHVVHTVWYAAYRPTQYRASAEMGISIDASVRPRPMPANANDTTRPLALMYAMISSIAAQNSGLSSPYIPPAPHAEPPALLISPECPPCCPLTTNVSPFQTLYPCCARTSTISLSIDCGPPGSTVVLSVSAQCSASENPDQ